MQDQYIQDSLALRIDGDRIPPVTPTTPATPRPRAPKRRLQDARSHGIPELKRCRDCNEVKPSSEFNRHTGNRDGLAHYCKPCSRSRSREQWKKYTRKDERTQAQWERRIQQLYGMTVQDYTDRADAQGNRCLICGASPQRLVVDHDHATGFVRGLLCSPCNTALGQMQDNPSFLRAAAEYLEMSSE